VVLFLPPAREPRGTAHRAQIGESAAFAVRPRPRPGSHRHRKRTLLNSKYRGTSIAVAESRKNRRPTMTTAAAALLLPPRLVSLPPHPSLVPICKNPAPSSALLGRRGARLRAVGDRPGAGLADQNTVYNGVYGPWTVEDSDVREVREQALAEALRSSHTRISIAPSPQPV
jgi:hypothetical protein